jgi:hypothetical protein
MPKTVQNVKNSLKFKARVKQDSISVRVGVKKYSLPIQARILGGGEYLFLSFPACSELFRVRDNRLEPMAQTEDASEAFEILSPPAPKRTRRSPAAKLPASLESALRDIPEGYRLGYDAGGRPRLVRIRLHHER